MITKLAMQPYNLVKCTKARHKAYMEFFDLKKVFIVIKLVFYLRLFKTRVCAKCLSCRVAKTRQNLSEK